MFCRDGGKTEGGKAATNEWTIREELDELSSQQEIRS